MRVGAARWTWAGRAFAVVALVAAAALAVVTLGVTAASGASVSCGSAWDVIAGRTGWQQWWAQDLAQPVPGEPLLRTVRCPPAVNDRIVVCAVLVGLAAVVLLGSVLVDRRGRAGVRVDDAMRRVRRLAIGLTALGALLTVAGLVGLALLTADPRASLFLYVGRGVVVLAGLVLLLPAVLIVALGRALMAYADAAPRPGVSAPPVEVSSEPP